MSDVFPSILPGEDDKNVTPSEVVEDIFEDKYPLLRKAIAVAGDQYEYELEVNGKSTKVEMSNWLANNMTRRGIETLKQKAQEEIDESN